jgi:hypothetical protein
MNGINKIYGGQLSLVLSNGSWNAVNSKSIVLNSGDYFIAENKLMLSWTSIESIADAEIEVTFVASENGQLSDILNLAFDFSSEVYAGEELVTYQLDLDYNKIMTTAGELEVYQNKPNPFSDATSIGFYIDQNDQVELTIFDMTGKIVHNETRQFRAGHNEFTINNSQLSATGVLYYQVNYQNSLVTKKMIYLNK